MEPIVPTDEELAEWEEWLADPEHAPVADVARRLPPWKVYWMKNPPGQRVMINSYHDILEDGERFRKGDVVLNVHVGSYLNFVVVERDVFDVPWQDLTECDDLRPWQEMP
jgi:hypothetical protein